MAVATSEAMRRAWLVFVLLVASASAWGNEPARTTPVRFKRPFTTGLSHLGDGPTVTIQNNQFGDHLQYRDIRGAAYHLLRTYPADRHFFVGLGRDPAPIIAFLQNIGGKQLAVNYPASSNSSASATQEILATYSERVIPAEVFASGRTVVFIDVTSSGRALDHYVPRIAPGLKGLPSIKVAFGINPTSSAIYTNPGDKHVVNTTPFPELDKFPWDPYENVVSEYPRHVPTTNGFGVLDTPRAEYQQLRDGLMQRMLRDPELDHFLKTEAGPAFKHDGE